MIFSGYMPSSEIAESYGSFIPSFLKNHHIVLLIVAVSAYIPTNRARGFPPPPHPLQYLLFVDFFFFFDDGHSEECEVILHCSFDLHFSNNE